MTSEIDWSKVDPVYHPDPLINRPARIERIAKYDGYRGVPPSSLLWDHPWASWREPYRRGYEKGRKLAEKRSP